jgi:hypothetical protein
MADRRSVAVSDTLESFAIAEPSFLSTSDMMGSMSSLQHEGVRIYLTHSVIRMAHPQDPLQIFLQQVRPHGDLPLRSG